MTELLIDSLTFKMAINFSTKNRFLTNLSFNEFSSLLDLNSVEVCPPYFISRP